jgi:hypothetical protein
MEPEKERRYKSTDQNRDFAVNVSPGHEAVAELSHANRAEERVGC